MAKALTSFGTFASSNSISDRRCVLRFVMTTTLLVSVTLTYTIVMRRVYGLLLHTLCNVDGLVCRRPTDTQGWCIAIYVIIDWSLFRSLLFRDTSLTKKCAGPVPTYYANVRLAMHMQHLLVFRFNWKFAVHCSRWLPWPVDWLAAQRNIWREIRCVIFWTSFGRLVTFILLCWKEAGRLLLPWGRSRQFSSFAFFRFRVEYVYGTDGRTGKTRNVAY